VRALLSDRPALLDPLTAEDELRNALGEPVTATHEVGNVATARITLLLALVASLDLDDHAIGDLLGEARNVANRSRKRKVLTCGIAKTAKEMTMPVTDEAWTGTYSGTAAITGEKPASTCIYERPAADHQKTDDLQIHHETSPRSPVNCGTQV
jgi:hypothetical protein